MRPGTAARSAPGCRRACRARCRTACRGGGSCARTGRAAWGGRDSEFGGTGAGLASTWPLNRQDGQNILCYSKCLRLARPV
eukprot:357997-Chlamydomonas_euryale.AAC.2